MSQGMFNHCNPWTLQGYPHLNYPNVRSTSGGSAMVKRYGKKALQAWFDEPEVAKIDRIRRGRADPAWAETIRYLVQLGMAAAGNNEKQLGGDHAAKPTTKMRKRPAAVRQQRAAAKADDSKATTEELQEDCAA
jgi:hypothetical protein